MQYNVVQIYDTYALAGELRDHNGVTNGSDNCQASFAWTQLSVSLY